MSALYLVGGLVAVLVLGMLALRVMLVFKVSKQQGKPAPALAGAAGAWIGRGKTALFYFHSPMCGACRSTTPVVRKLAERDRGVFAVDITQDMATARAFGIMATPTYVLVDRGIVQRILIGPQPEQTLTELLAGA